MNWQEFCEMYWDEAMQCARIHLAKIKKAKYPKNWDTRISEDDICQNVAVDVIEKAYENFDPTRGSSVTTYISCLAHNAVINELKEAQKLLTGELTASDEKAYTFKEGPGARIPEEEKKVFIEKLRNAMLQLSYLDQSILGFFMNETDYVAACVEELGIPANVVSVRKNRALKKLPKLMGVTKEEYLEQYDESYQYLANKCIQFKALEPVLTTYKNPIYPAFDLDATVLGLFNMLKGNLA